MDSEGSCLGVCYADNHLFYSVNKPGEKARIEHIGSIDFNFGVRNAIITGSENDFPALQTSLQNLKEKFGCTSVKILAPATEECWTIVPRAVYENASERESHIQLLMHGLDRSDVHATWHPVSNVDFRLLLLRNSSAMKGFTTLLGSFIHAEYVSEFELGADWQSHTETNGSFLMIHCLQNYISVSSYILGKLRGCTFLEYDDASDLPYLWNLYAEKLSWMRGIHEEMYLYGEYAGTVSEILNPFLDDSGSVQVMNTLRTMQVHAEEKTYGFRLESAFAAIMMSLNTDDRENQPVHENYHG